MHHKTLKFSGLILISMLLLVSFRTQISPGELAGPHSHLEGISNCTQCHVLGNKVSNEKCLKCHTEILERQNLQKGYHSSVSVKGKQCFDCHSDHNGKNFQMIRLDVARFDHNLTGFPLSVPHAKKGCQDCHSTKYITNQKLKVKKTTYLGVNPACLTCHTDYHQKTLSGACLNCHNPNSFKPATKFNHANAGFPLLGKHASVECLKCHKIETINGKKFQHFTDVQYGNCTDCHKDPHQNQFGQNCRQCHSEVSFQVVKGIEKFDHNKTAFRLEGEHQNINCKACHKVNFTNPLKHDRCIDCHTDYHNNQFAKNGISPDCSHCHQVTGFAQTTFGPDQHSRCSFPLRGAHQATPCFECHKKQEKWSFREIGFACSDCHQDIHQGYIQSKYYPESTCKTCHNESRWSSVTFDHTKTGFNLTGAHMRQECRSCHITREPDGKIRQRFSGIPANCSSCHKDNHFRQFEKNGVTNCERCHDSENWKASKFNHNTAAFKLEGKHIGVPCTKCHTAQQEGSNTYIQYKIKDYRCESCHL
jgi:hypothetical protein